MSLVEKWASRGLALTLDPEVNDLSIIGDPTEANLLLQINWSELAGDHIDLLLEMGSKDQNESAVLTAHCLMYANEFFPDEELYKRFSDGPRIVTYIKREILERVYRTKWRPGDPQNKNVVAFSKPKRSETLCKTF